MDFLTHDRLSPGDTALVDTKTGEEWTYRRLIDEVSGVAERLPEAKGMVLLLVRRDVPSLLGYLAALRRGHAVLPIEADLDPELLSGLVDTYCPEMILGGGPVFTPELGAAFPGYGRGPELHDSLLVLFRKDPPEQKIHPDLALLLSTSGSTGSPKLVRLSARNVMANGEGIREALGIDKAERAITSLAFSYSFGLSVLHSHLLAGASLAVTDQTVLVPAFWDELREHRATSFSGVPYSYELIRRVGFADMDLPSLRTLTQAGGKLGAEMVKLFHGNMVERGGDFVVMYGQTEATARISVLPPEMLPEKLGGVGFSLPGGKISIRREGDGEEVPAHATGEIVYTGPNVMMGYAESRGDLSRGDDLGGELSTGDLGHLDEDGVLFVTGRLKRFAKVFGLRVSLDDVEGQLQGVGSVAALDGGRRVVVCCLPEGEAPTRGGVRALAQKMHMHGSAFSVRVVDRFPTLSNGKIDYRALTEMVLG